MSQEQKVQFIRPPNTLRAKVVEGGPHAVNDEVLEQAEQVIAGMADAYIEWAIADLARLNKACAALGTADGERRLLGPVFHVAHDMKGLGGSFDYQLITIIADRLCRFVENVETVGAAERDVIRLHVDALQLVIVKRIKGDGGADGTVLLGGLEKVIAKLSR